MLDLEEEQISLMKLVQVVFHSYLTIWMRMLLHFERMLCRGRERFSSAAYLRIISTMYVLKDYRCSAGRACHFCWVKGCLP